MIQILYEWYFTPDAEDVKSCRNAYFPCRSGTKFKSDTAAIRAGTRWKKESHRTGTITAIPAEKPHSSYIFDC